MATYVKFQDFAEQLAKKQHNFGSDTIKVALSNTAPNVATASQLSNITQIAAGNGYTAGGFTLTGTSFTETAGVGTFFAADLVITAAGGSMAPFRYAIYYNDTATNDLVIAYLDQGSAITLANGEAVTLKFSDNTPAGKVFDIS